MLLFNTGADIRRRKKAPPQAAASAGALTTAPPVVSGGGAAVTPTSTSPVLAAGPVPFVQTVDRRNLSTLQRIAERLHVPTGNAQRATLLIRLRQRAIVILQRWVRTYRGRTPHAVCVNEVDPVTQEAVADIPAKHRFVVVLPGSSRQYCVLDAMALGDSILASGKATNWVTQTDLNAVELSRLDRLRRRVDAAAPSVVSGLEAAAAAAAEAHDAAMVGQAFQAMLAASWQHISSTPFALDVSMALLCVSQYTYAYANDLHEYACFDRDEAVHCAEGHAAELVAMLLDKSGAQGDEVAMDVIRNRLCCSGSVCGVVFTRAMVTAGIMQQPPPADDLARRHRHIVQRLEWHRARIAAIMGVDTSDEDNDEADVDVDTNAEPEQQAQPDTGAAVHSEHAQEQEATGPLIPRQLPAAAAAAAAAEVPPPAGDALREDAASVHDTGNDTEDTDAQEPPRRRRRIVVVGARLRTYAGAFPPPGGGPHRERSAALRLFPSS